jgi:hypothetical protein
MVAVVPQKNTSKMARLGTGREVNAAAVIAGIEGAVVERPSTVRCLDLHKGVVASGYVAQRDGAVFQVSTTQEHNGRGSRVLARTL